MYNFDWESYAKMLEHRLMIVTNHLTGTSTNELTPNDIKTITTPISYISVPEYAKKHKIPEWKVYSLINSRRVLANKIYSRKAGKEVWQIQE